MTPLPLEAEWLETDGEGGFASGTVAGVRTRRYHALLLTASAPPPGRMVLVNGLEVSVETPGGTTALSTQHYAPDVTFPRGVDNLVAFAADPWPRWSFRIDDGREVVHECFVDRRDRSVVLTWRIAGAGARATLTVRPLLSGRDFHALMRENPVFDFSRRQAGGNVTWKPYAGVPAVTALSNARYVHAPTWYRNFLYRDEAARGLDCTEDLATPGTLTFDLAAGDAVLVLRAGDEIDADALSLAAALRAREASRRSGESRVARAAGSYVVGRSEGQTIIAGYPWFGDWGRDTFVALRGLALARSDFATAATVLRTWAATISEGMIPNRFPDGGGIAEYNSVDASLWFVVAAAEYLEAGAPAAQVRDELQAAMAAILDAYIAGTRYAIAMDGDGLLACGVAGVQLTWMDAKVGNHVVTPRVGKPVEVQALWINALRLAGGRYAGLADRAQATFRARFWNAATGCLYDVVDADHVLGRTDARLRPNQIFAAGGLPYVLVDEASARAMVATIERELVTPMGLRSLAPSDPAYCPRYEGGVAQRDAAYHQGTVWPWLMASFVDAWLRVHGDSDDRRREARRRFVAPLEENLNAAGLGHVSEIADGDWPHAPRGCPFQAWSLGELWRAQARTATPR